MTESTPNISIIGTGLLGKAIAQRLLTCGHKLIAYNRTREKALPLEAHGAYVVDTAEEAVQASDAVLFVLTHFVAIHEVMGSLKRGSLKGKTVINMSTISPEESMDFQEFVKEKGGVYLECPVLGSRPEAQEGQLIVMAAGDQAVFEQWKSLLDCIAGHVRFVGSTGQAACCKLALNNLIISHAVGFSTSLSLIRKFGIPPKIFMELLRPSALYAPMMDKKLKRWLTRNYDDPNFPLKHLRKDCDLIAGTVSRSEINTGPLAAAMDLLDKAVAMGLADADYSAVFEVINGDKLS